ncbi:MAG: hypothetical protein HRT40_01415 [Campylobacteraceae bacterium]|nr:hypothetical protein [Campylobacteraceae bacterium]
MVYFKVSANINIKTTDGTLVKYLCSPEHLVSDEYIFCSSYTEFQDLKKVFSRVDKKYQANVLLEEKILNSKKLPIELGISNSFEYRLMRKYDLRIKNNTFLLDELKDKIKEVSFNENRFDFYKQIKNIRKKDIKVAVIAGMGRHMGENLSSCTALRILYEELNRFYENVQIDVFLESSENQYYSRDKEILLTQNFISSVKPLALTLKELCDYDFFIDNSLVYEKSYYKNLAYVDAYLYKFGIDYTKIDSSRKATYIDRLDKKVSNELILKLQDIKKRSKIVLYHPYAAKEDRSIPKSHAIKYLKKLIKKMPDYTIITSLDIGADKNLDYINLASYSKSFSDFAYIISQSDKLISCDTSAYHIADAFFIPTVVIFTSDIIEKRTKYYNFTKSILLKDQTKQFSSFVFENQALELCTFKAWDKFKISRIISLLETI